MKKNQYKYQGLFRLLIPVLAAAVIAAGFYGYRHVKDMSHLNRLEEIMPTKVETMLQSLEKQDAEAILAVVHPIAEKYGDESQAGIAELLEFLDDRTVSQLQLPEPNIWERGDGEYLAKSTGTVTLSDGSRYSVTYTYLLDGREGFINFQIDSKGVNI